MWLLGSKSSGSQDLEDLQDTQLLNMYTGVFLPPVKKGRWGGLLASRCKGLDSASLELGSSWEYSLESSKGAPPSNGICFEPWAWKPSLGAVV